MDLNRLSYFVRVVESGSFTAAAAALRLPKSSVSRHVTQLEQDLGVRLLQRTTRQLHLTDAGRALFDRARAAVADLDEATADVAQMSEEPRGTVRLTIPVDDGGGGMADAIVKFVKRYPLIRVEIAVTNRHVDLVHEGFDLALRAGPLTDSTLVARKVGSTDVALYAAPSYLRKRGRPKTLAELARHDCVLFRVQMNRVGWTLNGPHGNETVSVSGPISADDLTFVRRAVMEGAGIGFFPAIHAHDALVSGELERVLPDYALRDTPMHVVMPSARYVPVRVALLRDFLVEYLGTLAQRACPQANADQAGMKPTRAASRRAASPRRAKA